MCPHGQSTLVSTPDWLWSSRCRPEAGIAIDQCIADAILAAWAAGVRTLGSCCGHGKRPPDVVLTQDRDQPALARRELPGFTLYQWRLCDVTDPAEEGPPLCAGGNGGILGGRRR